MNNIDRLKKKIKEFSDFKLSYEEDYLLYKEILELCNKIDNSDKIKNKIMEMFAKRYGK